jgi:Fur family transcriptional regulator, ferric uptake regulator
MESGVAGGQEMGPVEERLLERGVRPTRQRTLVLAALAEELDDATAHQLFERLRGRGERIGLATVYRTLAALVESGVVEILNHRTGERCYRLCRSEEHHHHLVCSRCHRVVELVQCDLGAMVDRLSAEHGFVAERHEFEVTGICGDCRAAA